MSIATLERAILAELKSVAKNPKLRLKDIMEWSTGEVKAQPGEALYFLPALKVHCSVKVTEKQGNRAADDASDDANREMLGDDAAFFDGEDVGNR